MQSDQDLRNSQAIYDESGKATGGLLLLLIEQMLKKKLDLEVERVEEQQSEQGSGLTVERMDERESGLTVERMDGQEAVSQLTELAAAAKAKQQNDDRVVDEVLQSLEDFANPQSAESAAPKQEEVQTKPKLLFGQEDGKSVNRMTDEEITAIAKILTSPKGENVPGGENLRIKYNGVVIAETNAQGEITINEAYKKLDPQIVKQIEEAIGQVPQSKAPEATPPVAAVAPPKPRSLPEPEPEKPQPDTKPAVTKPVKRTTSEALADLLGSAQSAGANLIAGIVRKVEEHNRPVPKKREQDPIVNENRTDLPVVGEVAVVEGLTAAEYAANKKILTAKPKDYTAYTEITDVHISRTGQIRDLIEWTAEAAGTAELSNVENEFTIKTDRGYLVTCEPSADGFNYTLMKGEQLMLSGVEDSQKEWVILISAEGNLETGVLKVTNYDADAKKEIAAEIKAMRDDLEAFKAIDSPSIDLPKESPAQLMPWQDKGLLAESQANNLVQWASTSEHMVIPDGETEKKVKSSYRAVEVIATVDGAEASTIAYELRDLTDNKSLTVICEIENGNIIDINGDVTPLIIEQIDSIEEVLERENAAHIPAIPIAAQEAQRQREEGIEPDINQPQPQRLPEFESIIDDMFADPDRNYEGIWVKDGTLFVDMNEVGDKLSLRTITAAESPDVLEWDSPEQIIYAVDRYHAIDPSSVFSTNEFGTMSEAVEHLRQQEAIYPQPTYWALKQAQRMREAGMEPNLDELIKENNEQYQIEFARSERLRAEALDPSLKKLSQEESDLNQQPTPAENTIEVKTAIDKLRTIADEKLGHEESGEIVVDDDRFKLRRSEDEIGVTYEAVGKDGGVIKWEYAKEEDQIFLNYARLSTDIQHGVDTLSPETPAPTIEIPAPIKGKDEPVIQMSATERIAAQKLAKEQAKSEPDRAKAPAKTQSIQR
jgi:hypothetical protein